MVQACSPMRYGPAGTSAALRPFSADKRLPFRCFELIQPGQIAAVALCFRRRGDLPSRRQLIGLRDSLPPQPSE